MDDIVTRLREACAHLCKQECHRENAYVVGLEAADEIERLREENKRLVSLQKVLDLLYEHD